MKALVIGGSSWDTLLHVPDINVVNGDLTLWASKVIKTVGGTGAGKALALSALGADVTLVTPLGNDENRQKVLDFFKKTDINVIEVESNETTTHTNLMHSKGKR